MGNGTILTHSGRWVNLLNPDPDSITLTDIAVGLSKTQRFNGQTLCASYTVAQHCVLVAYQCPGPIAIHGLLHDAAEAYMGDVLRPIKEHLSTVAGIESGLLTAIYTHFNVPLPTPQECAAIKEIDTRMCNTEGLQLMHNNWRNGSHPQGEPYSFTITPLSPQNARWLFLDAARWYGLG